jgi:hypothetical protein
MLRAWYHGMLDRAKAEGIVIRTTNLYDEYFVKGGVDSVPWATGRATCLPYFEGDYIPGEIETIIKTERKKETPVSDSNGEDTVMTRLGFNLRKMKDNFIVVHLRSRRFAAAVESGDDVSEFKDDSDDEIVRSKRAKISGKDAGLLRIKDDLFEHAGSILKEEPTTDALTEDECLTASLSNEQTVPLSESQLAGDNNDLEQDSGSDAKLVATERTHSQCSETEGEDGNDVKPVREESSPPAGNGDVSTSEGNAQEETKEEVNIVEEQPVEITTTVEADDAESKTTALAAVEIERVDETDEQGNNVITEAQNVVDCELPSLNTDLEQALGSQPVTDNDLPEQAGSQTNQERISDHGPTNSDNRPEGDEKETGDCNFELAAERDAFNENNVDEGSKSNNVDVKSVDHEETNEAENIEKELTGVDVAIKNGPKGSNDLLSTTNVKQFEDDSMVNNEDVKGSLDVVTENVAVDNDATGESVMEVVDDITANANPLVGDNDDSHPCCDETQETLQSTAKVVGENQDKSSACEGDIVTAISAGNATNQVEADDSRQTSFTKAAGEDAAPGQVILPASDREENSFTSEVVDKEQISCVETMTTDEQPSKKVEEFLKDSPVTNETREAEDTEPRSTADPLAHLTSDHEHPTAPSDSTAGFTYAEQVSSSDAVDQISIDPGLSVEDTQRVSKRGIEEVTPLLSRHFEEVNPSRKYVTDTVDPDEPIEIELFESRQRFLNYCQSSHCQFDELRRAKHSTMMVLFQLHNPAAPLFLQQCGACYRDITHGVRYSCNNCSKFDLCEDCYKPVTSGLWAKRDSRFEHDLSHTFTPIDMEVSIDSAMSHEDRQKALKAHCALLEHAGDCQGAPVCSLQNCQKMKKLFNHVRSCDIKPKTDCRICTRLISLCAIHARTCEVADSCPVPFCDRIRDRNERLQRQQQLMDDRRRQAQNELYHTS